MTLEQILALFPDNTTGDIDAVDVRDAVTALWNRASLITQAFSYQYAPGSTAPTVGRLSVDDWDNPTTLYVNETDDSGQVHQFLVIDATATETEVFIAGNNGGRLRLDIVGPTVDLGTYRSIPVTKISGNGPTPLNNERLTVGVLVSVI